MVWSLWNLSGKICTSVWIALPRGISPRSLCRPCGIRAGWASGRCTPLYWVHTYLWKGLLRNCIDSFEQERVTNLIACAAMITQVNFILISIPAPNPDTKGLENWNIMARRKYNVNWAFSISIIVSIFSPCHDIPIVTKCWKHVISPSYGPFVGPNICIGLKMNF